MHIPLIVLFFWTYFISGSLCKTSIPAYVNLCKQSNPNLDECILNTINDLKPHLTRGIPEMKIAGLEPFRISKLTLRTSSNFKATFNDVELWNLLSYEVKRFHMDLNAPEISMDVFFPNIGLKGKYKLEGNILLFDINGSGDSTINMTNVDLHLKIKGNKVIKNGKEFADFKQANMDIKFEDGKLYFGNLFEGNDDLTEKVNAAFNENSKILLKEFEPALSDVLKNVALSLVKNVFDTFPMEELLPK